MNNTKWITLLDTIGNTCIVKMPKWIFARFFSDNLVKKSKSKYDILMEAVKDAENSDKIYHSVEELFKDLKS